MLRSNFVIRVWVLVFDDGAELEGEAEAADGEETEEGDPEYAVACRGVITEWVDVPPYGYYGGKEK